VDLQFYMPCSLESKVAGVTLSELKLSAIMESMKLRPIAMGELVSCFVVLSIVSDSLRCIFLRVLRFCYECVHVSSGDQFII
jgi:hypothetical protein